MHKVEKPQIYERIHIPRSMEMGVIRSISPEHYSRGQFFNSCHQAARPFQRSMRLAPVSHELERTLRLIANHTPSQQEVAAPLKRHTQMSLSRGSRHSTRHCGSICTLPNPAFGALGRCALDAYPAHSILCLPDITVRQLYGRGHAPAAMLSAHDLKAAVLHLRFG